MKTALVVSMLISALAYAHQTRIVGGTETANGDYPIMTDLVRKGSTPSSGQLCGASRVAPQWVLTAGHSMKGTPASSVDVWVGGRDRRNASEGMRVGVSQVIIHPGYGTNTQGAIEYDFCLLKLASSITSITPLPLVESSAQVAVGTTCRVIGWGTMSESGTASQVLRQVDMPIASLLISGQKMKGLNSTHLAAGRASGGLDSCQSDSGGPLLVRNNVGSWAHGGTVSFGNGCARAGEYGIYGNTIMLKSWMTGYINSTNTPTDDHGNTTSAATTISLGNSITGNLVQGNDMVVFKIMLTNPGSLTVTSSGSTDVIGTLLTSTGSLLSSDDDNAGSPHFNLTYNATVSTTVCVKVSGKTSATTGGNALNATFSEAIAGAPEIDMRLGVYSQLANNSSVNFGSRLIGSSSLNQTFTIANLGNVSLAINGARIKGDASFRLVTTPASSVGASRYTRFAVGCQVGRPGSLTAKPIVDCNDADENPTIIISALLA